MVTNNQPQSPDRSLSGNSKHCVAAGHFGDAAARSLLPLGLMIAFVLAASGSVFGQSPNVILVIADDLGYGELGCYGGTEIPTPNLDALAQDGIRYTDGYVTAPFCAASRAAIMTGRYQTRFGFEFNPIGAENSKPGIGLPTGQTTLAEAMRSAGYSTGLIGKWHLGGNATYHPQRHGFDDFFGFLHEGHFFVPPPYQGVTTWLRRETLPGNRQGRWTSPSGKTVWSTHLGRNEPPYDANNPVMRSSQPVAEHENLTDAFTREAIGFIERNRSQPFFLTVAYNAVHSPLQGEDEYMMKFQHIDDIQRRIFASMLSHLDDSVGRLVESLQQHGLRQNTLLVFLSDNGGPTAELTSSNAPLRGGKGTVYEGGIRVPFIVSWPNKIRPAVSSSPVISTDIMATALELARGEKPKLAIDGRSLIKPNMDAESAGPRTLFWRLGSKHAMRHGDWKLARNKGPWELYDLRNDVGETTDLASSHPGDVTSLAKIWDRWNAQQVEPLWD